MDLKYNFKPRPNDNLPSNGRTVEWKSNVQYGHFVTLIMINMKGIYEIRYLSDNKEGALK